MASIVIDFNNLLIKLVCGAGESNVNFQVKDIYETWKQTVILGDNLKYPQAMFSVGGEPLGGGEALGAAFFLKNTLGWRIAPVTLEDHTEIQLIGNLFRENTGLALFNYDNVAAHSHIEMRTSTLPSIIETGVSGLTPEEAAKLDVIETVNTLSQQILKLSRLIPAAL